jgi:uncharacterized repeat protein (TIGR01451 family)
MNYLTGTRLLSVGLAAVLHLMPFIRATISLEARGLPAASWAWILKLGGGAVALLGSYDAVSGATNIVAPYTVNATNGVSYRRTLTTSGQTAMSWSANTAPKGSAVYPLTPGLWLTNRTGRIAGTPTWVGVSNIVITAWENNNNTGASVSQTFVFTIVGTAASPPTITGPPQNQMVVAGGSATFSVTATGTAPLSYQWRFKGTAIPSATNSSYTRANVQPADAGAYSVVIANSAGTTTSTDAILTVIESPSITAQPVAQTVNVGGTATFSVTATGTAPLSYQWRLNGAPLATGTTSSYTVASAQLSDAGAYSVVVANDAGSVTSLDAALTVVQPATVPVITGPPQSQTINAGASATFSVTATGTAPLTYQWRFNTAPIAGATTSTYTRPNVQEADAGAYSVVVANAAGSVTSADATLTVATPPTITSQPANASANVGGSATFSVVANGTAPLTYQWRFNTAPIAGATTSTYTRPNVQAADAGAYSVVVANAAGSVTSADATLAVVTPPAITAQPVSQSVNVSSNATFSVTATGTAPLTYQWRFKAVAIPGATTSTYTRSNAQLTDAGAYSVIVANAAGSVTSADAVLTVVQPATPPSIASQPQSLSVKAGSSATFSVVATGSPPLTYQWRFNNVSIPGATTSAYTRQNVQAADAGGYTVVVSNAAGSTTSSEALLTVLPLSADLVATVSGPSVVQPGATFSYTVNVSNLGPDSASTVVVSDTLPAGVTFVSAPGGAVPNGVVTWTAIATLTNAGSASFVVTVMAPASGSLTNRVSLTSTTADPNPANNNGSAAAAQVITSVETQAPPTISGVFMDASNPSTARFGFQFSSVSGKVYSILYTDDDMKTWKTVNGTVTATGATTSWVDSGPPVTDSRPAGPHRFYRVQLMP